MRCLLFAVTAVAFRVYDEVSLPPKTYYYLNETNETRKELMKDLGCYCKNVASMKDCPDFKTDKKKTDPEYTRWFHPNVSTGSDTPHLCCKLARTSWFDRKGLSYTKQETAERCFSEVRPFSKDACCRIGKEEAVAVRVKQIAREALQNISGPSSSPPEYGKSFPYFSVNDIAGATDHDGTELSVQQVIELLQYKAQAKAIHLHQGVGETAYMCSKDTDALIADQEDCRFRTDPTTECCCPQATVVPAQRCLPAAGGATWEAMRFTGKYTQKKKEYEKEELWIGEISFQKTFQEYGESVEKLDKDLPGLLQSQDPDEQDPDGLEYDWSRAPDQWKKPICKATRPVASVWAEERRGDQEKLFGAGYWYHQDWKPKCISVEFNRICPKGQGLYVKQIPLGTCTKVPGPSNSDQLQMVGLGSGLMFQCPDGYQSGTKGAMKRDAHCKCDGC